MLLSLAKLQRARLNSMPYLIRVDWCTQWLHKSRMQKRKSSSYAHLAYGFVVMPTFYINMNAYEPVQFMQTVYEHLPFVQTKFGKPPIWLVKLVEQF